MAEGQDLSHSLTYKSSWYHSSTFRSSQSPVSPSSFSETCEWYLKASSCTLVCDNMSAQGIVALVLSEKIAKLLRSSGLGSSSRLLVLLTNHHVISSKKAASEWEISMGLPPKQNIKLKLREDSIDSCFSCCGPDGVFCDDPHEKDSCPIGSDFTLLVLSNKIAEKIFQRDLLFLSIDSMSGDAVIEALKNDRFTLFNRDKKTGVIRENELKMKPQGPPTDECYSIESKIAAFKAVCLLNYNYESDVQSGASGAGLCGRNNGERTLLGLHVCHERERREQYGTTVYSILCSIEGGDTLISCISQLKDVMNHSPRSSKVEKWYKHLQNYLASQNRRSEAQESHADDERYRLILQLLKYLLHSQYPKFIVIDGVKGPLMICSLTLLSEVLKVLTVRNVSAIVKEFVNDKGENTLYVKLKEASKQVLRIIKEYQDDEATLDATLEACYECYSEIMKFPFDNEAHPYQNAPNFAILKRIRDDPRYSGALAIQKCFGDICMSYQPFMREIHMQYKTEELQRLIDQKMEIIGEQKNMIEQIEVDQGALQKELQDSEQKLVNSSLANHELSVIIGKIEAENKELNVENEKLSIKACNGHDVKTISSQRSTSSDNYPIPRAKSGNLDSNCISLESNLIWDQDMQETIKDISFREKIAKFFKKTPASKSEKTWEHLLIKLKLNMDVEDLELVDVGIILTNIITEWSKTERVSVRMFCKVCDEMGIKRIRQEFDNIHSNDKSFSQLGRSNSSVSNSNSVDV